MRIGKKHILALVAAMLFAAPAVYADSPDDNQVLGNSNVRFVKYSFQDEEPAVDTRPPFRPPLGQQVVTNSYWEIERSSTLQPPPNPTNEIPAPAATTQEAAPTIGNCNVGCDTCCESCRPPIQFIAMAESTFFWPQMSRRFLSTSTINGLGTQQFNSSGDNASVEGGLLVSPRITLGFQGCKWGLVGRYWYASNWDSSFFPNIPGAPTTGIVAFDGLRAYTADLEVQRRFVGCVWEWYGFCGVRYASANNDRSLAVGNSFGGDVLNASAFSTQQFNGAGVTFGTWGVRPLNECSPLSIYYVNRYSFVGGRGAAGVETSAAASDVNGNANSVNGTFADGDGTLFIGELQLGLQWNGKLACLPGVAFFRAGVEYQYWDTSANVFARANSTAFVSPNAEASAAASAGDMLFQFFGMTLGVGLMY